MSQLIITEQAEADLEDIWLYVAHENPTAADRLIDRIYHVCEELAGAPGIGRRRDELAPALRSFPMGNYLIFYRPFADGIAVVRVLSGYRDIEALLDLQ